MLSGQEQLELDPVPEIEEPLPLEKPLPLIDKASA